MLSARDLTHATGIVSLLAESTEFDRTISDRMKLYVAADACGLEPTSSSAAPLGSPPGVAGSPSMHGSQQRRSIDGLTRSLKREGRGRPRPATSSGGGVASRSTDSGSGGRRPRAPSPPPLLPFPRRPSRRLRGSSRRRLPLGP